MSKTFKTIWTGVMKKSIVQKTTNDTDNHTGNSEIKCLNIWEFRSFFKPLNQGATTSPPTPENYFPPYQKTSCFLNFQSSFQITKQRMPSKLLVDEQFQNFGKTWVSEMTCFLCHLNVVNIKYHYKLQNSKSEERS